MRMACHFFGVIFSRVLRVRYKGEEVAARQLMSQGPEEKNWRSKRKLDVLMIISSSLPPSAFNRNKPVDCCALSATR